MCKLSIQEYVLNKSKHAIDAYNEAIAYRRDLLNMIQRTLGPLNRIENQLIMTPLYINHPTGAQNILYDVSTESYKINTTCLMENRTVQKQMNVTLTIPTNVFNISNEEEIELYYIDKDKQEIIKLLEELEIELAEQLKRLDPLKNMLKNGENIGQIGGQK